MRCFQPRIYSYDGARCCFGLTIKQKGAIISKNEYCDERVRESAVKIRRNSHCRIVGMPAVCCDIPLGNRKVSYTGCFSAWESYVRFPFIGGRIFLFVKRKKKGSKENEKNCFTYSCFGNASLHYADSFCRGRRHSC